MPWPSGATRPGVPAALRAVARRDGCVVSGEPWREQGLEAADGGSLRLGVRFSGRLRSGRLAWAWSTASKHRIGSDDRACRVDGAGKGAEEHRTWRQQPPSRPADTLPGTAWKGLPRRSTAP
jgi:hypothetical protein